MPCLSLLVVIFAGVSIFLFWQKQLLEERLTECEESSSATCSLPGGEKTPGGLEPTLTPEPLVGESFWKRAEFGGLFSYEYPEGWHVAELWLQDQAGSVITVAMDPKPISTAPRGGSLATLELAVRNGLPNPNEVLSQMIDVFRSELSDLEEEIIQSELGPITHIKGKYTMEMFKGEPVEKYFLTFETGLNDPINQQVITASLFPANDKTYSDMLERVVMSLKKRQLN